MKSVRYTRRASADFDDIADYTARVWGAVQAKKYIAELRGHIQKIASASSSEMSSLPIFLSRRHG